MRIRRLAETKFRDSGTEVRQAGCLNDSKCIN